jgi:hypothetical protein
MSSSMSSAISCGTITRGVLGARRHARPTYAEERAWLSEHGTELLAYRVPKRRAA